uniref:MIF4G domain-containing protein n=1 Tax=Meloidogyne hapla TaxID=6305 RepID=A0A1I8AXB6_MELHA
MSTTTVFEGFQIYSNQSKRVSIDQLSQQLPQLFSKKDVNQVAQFECSNQFSMESLISGRMFLPFPLKEYLMNYLKKMDEDCILNMAKSLIERIVKNDEDRKNFDRLLDFTLVFMDCCAQHVKGNFSNEMTEALQTLHKELENLLTQAETSQKNSSEMSFKSKMTPTVPLTDYYMERIELRKI